MKVLLLVSVIGAIAGVSGALTLATLLAAFDSPSVSGASALGLVIAGVICLHLIDTIVDRWSDDDAGEGR